ncbi:hypothetical protein SLEP1_g40206 [Rubroshorea leprosula]|uniref:Uncharacterized protein n=1 Tax=Rubroshorea leprosula TaxID=152421 RepID=A0AAV5L3K0_9ROSI|nr:hypothetical protein SLEP1_g40206 [Rubroshorea leprosula]
MQQQFGVFQQVLAQLLARNNPGDPLINLLNPAPPPNPEPVQHAPAVSESQGQSHIAPVMQPPRDEVNRRLDSLEKLVVEQRGIPPPHPAADSVPHPLNTNIILEPYPAGFRIPQLETYDGTKDPDDHLHAFYSCMQAQNASDALMCKIFPSTLRGNARTWYYSLPPRSINSYTELSSAFATKFSSRRLIRKTTSELMRVKQRDGESLKNFMSRFNDAVLKVNSFDQAVGITVVISGLGHERFRESLLKHPATTFSEVNDRLLKFITAEEYVLSQNITPVKNQHPDWRDENPNRKRMKTPQNRGPMSTSTLRLGRPNSAPPQQPAGKPPVNWTPFNLPRSQIFMQIKNKMDLRRLGPMRTAAATRDHTRYCDFHQDHGHTTEQCNSLRSELESLAQKGMLNEYIQRVEQPRFVREQGTQHQGVRNPPNRQGVGYQQAPPPLPPPARVIHMITGGLEAGGLSSKQRKLYVREVKHQNRAQKRKFDDAEWKNQPITFTSADLETVVTPHNDPLVTSVTINNCEVQRVLVDTGSAPDIMYFHCFESLGIDPALLQRYDGPIYGFNNQPVPVEGVLTMNVAFVSGRSYVTPTVRFLVVKMASSFNVVIGRPTLTEIRAVVSQSHLCMKFPTPMGIATLRGNQEVARHCYITSITQPQKGKTQTPEINPKQIPDDRQVMGVEIVDNRPEDETRAAPVEDVEEVQIDDRDPSRKTQIGTKLNSEERAELIAFLRANNDVFAWTSADMPGIPISVFQHKLSTNPLKKPVVQKRRLFGGGRLKVIKEEVEKLLQAGFVRRVDYCEWVANPVLVKKANGKWRISAIRAQALADFIVECTPGNSIPTLEPNDWTLYVDGASSSKGSGAGALLIGPDGYRSEHALKFNFDATNNMAEYEALLLGLQLALELKLSAIQVYSDSQLVVNQINSICEVVDPVMVKYVALIAELKCKFQKFCLSKIPRTENEQADSLSKFASDSSSHSRSVFVEVLDEPSFVKPRVMEISTDPDTPSWTDPILSFLRDGIVPEDRQEAMKLRRKASRYTLVDGVLYKRSFSLPLLRCLNPYEVEYALREVHEGVCGSHVGARTLAHKVLRQGYYWPNMYKDATHFVQRCLKCQFFAHLTHQLAEELTTLVAPWPFAQWGLDLLGPFVKGVGGVTHLIVGVDYFTKWVEARPISSLTSKKVEDFVFSSIICRYGIPNQIFTSVYHLESNGMVESVNKCILEGIKPRLEQHKAKWAGELNNVLWAYRTTSRTATGETPYHLAFGTEAVIPVEIRVPSFRVTHFDEGRNGQLLRENLDLLDDVREEARLRTLVYKQKIANFYNRRVRPRTFKIGDLVLRKAGLTGFETRFGKLAPNWAGPYTVAEVPHPGAYILRDTEGNRVPRVWNVNNLKKFYP